jgi:hypothetical protein
MKNNFGNFVVQKALKMANESRDKNLLKLIQLINKNLEKIGEKKLILKWRSIINSYDNFSSGKVSVLLTSGSLNASPIQNLLPSIGQAGNLTQTFTSRKPQSSTTSPLPKASHFKKSFGQNCELSLSKK